MEKRVLRLLRLISVTGMGQKRWQPWQLSDDQRVVLASEYAEKLSEYRQKEAGKKAGIASGQVRKTNDSDTVSESFKPQEIPIPGKVDIAVTAESIHDTLKNRFAAFLS